MATNMVYSLKREDRNPSTAKKLLIWYHSDVSFGIWYQSSLADSSLLICNLQTELQMANFRLGRILVKKKTIQKKRRKQERDQGGERIEIGNRTGREQKQSVIRRQQKMGTGWDHHRKRYKWEKDGIGNEIVNENGTGSRTRTERDWEYDICSRS